MRAVMVLVLPETPDGDDGALAELLEVAGRALAGVPELSGIRMIVTIRESADAVLLAAEGPRKVTGRG